MYTISNALLLLSSLMLKQVGGQDQRDPLYFIASAFTIQELSFVLQNTLQKSLQTFFEQITTFFLQIIKR